MPGLKKHHSDVRFSGNKVTPDEIDMRVRYMVQNPTVSASYIGTVTSAVAADFVLDNISMDYPRNVLLTITGVSGGMGGTVTIVGTNQFGVGITEEIGFASAANGGTKAGTKVFEYVTSATLDGLAGLGGTAIATASLGAAIGTAANIVNWFGLPVKVNAVSDVKKILWNDAGTMKAVNGGTVTSTYVSVANQAFTHGQIVAAADGVYVEVLPTYDSSNDANVS